jgi:hypothetical protein
MSWEIGRSRIKLENKNGTFSVNLSNLSQKISLSVLEFKNLPSLDNIDTEQQISFYEWILYNGKRKFAISYRNDLKKVAFVQYQNSQNCWKLKATFSLHENEYKKLLNIVPNINGLTNPFTKICIHLNEDTTYETVE